MSVSSEGTNGDLASLTISGDPQRTIYIQWWGCSNPSKALLSKTGKGPVPKN